MKISAFVTDERLEQEGVWVDIGHDARVRVARAGNPKHDALVRKLRKPHEPRFRGGEIPSDLLTKIAVEGMAQHILLDWEGITEDDGTPIPYSTENARRLLSVKDFRNIIAELAQEMETFRAQEIEEASGNLTQFPAVATGVEPAPAGGEPTAPAHSHGRADAVLGQPPRAMA